MFKVVSDTLYEWKEKDPIKLTIHYLKTKKFNHLKTLLSSKEVTIYRCIWEVFNNNLESDEKVFTFLSSYSLNSDHNSDIVSQIKLKAWNADRSVVYLKWFIDKGFFHIYEIFYYTPANGTRSPWENWSIAWNLFDETTRTTAIDNLLDNCTTSDVFIFLVRMQAGNVQYINYTLEYIRYLFKKPYDSRKFNLDIKICSFVDVNAVVDLHLQVYKKFNNPNYVIQHDIYGLNYDAMIRIYDIVFTHRSTAVSKQNIIDLVSFSRVSQRLREDLLMELNAYNFTLSDFLDITNVILTWRFECAGLVKCLHQFWNYPKDSIIVETVASYCYYL
jgi:hypothetical protein